MLLTWHNWLTLIFDFLFSFFKTVIKETELKYHLEFARVAGG